VIHLSKKHSRWSLRNLGLDGEALERLQRALLHPPEV